MAVGPGDVVEVGPPGPRLPVPQGITILHEDRDIIVIDKRENLLTMATPTERDRTAYAVLFDYVRRQDKRARVFIVHRIDRRTSGILVFARSEEAKRKLQEQFRAQTAERAYLAIVEGAVEPAQGTFQSYVMEDAHLRARPTTDRARGRLAITHYRVVGRGGRHSVLEVRLGTGRKGQIRLHLAEAGHPIVGDPEYGSTTNPLKRLGLHAHRLTFTHPGTGRRVTFEAPVPAPFRRFLGGNAPGDASGPAGSDEEGPRSRGRAGPGGGGDGSR
jgi:23S rRNA pseudouridine1911/1915/1917 synthase